MSIQRNFDSSPIKRPPSLSQSFISGVKDTTKFFAKEGLKEGTKILPEVGEYAGAGLSVVSGNPELAPAFAWAGKKGGKFLQSQADKFINTI